MQRTISAMVGKGSVNHNSRKFRAENVDGTRTHLNIDYCNENIKTVYHELFDEALERYNAKQIRSDRKIKDYYEKSRSSKQEKPFHEIILQVGGKGNMNADTSAEFTGTEPDAYCSNTFTLYFTDKSGQKLVKEQRTVRYKRSIPKERIVLEQLMKGPLEKGHYPTIPENTEVLNVTIADRICYVAFDGV